MVDKSLWVRDVVELLWVTEKLDEAFFDGSEIVEEYLLLAWCGLVWRECCVGAEECGVVHAERLGFGFNPGSVDFEV